MKRVRITRLPVRDPNTANPSKELGLLYLFPLISFTNLLITFLTNHPNIQTKPCQPCVLHPNTATSTGLSGRQTSLIIISMCFGEAQQPTTESGRNYVKLTRLIIVVQFIITVLNFVAADFFLREAIFGVMFLLLLYAAQHHLSYQVIMIYIFISIFFAFRYLLFFLEPIQNRRDIDTLEDIQKLSFYVAIVSFAYYLFCVFFFYFPYREFKIQAYLQNPALRNYFQREQENQQAEQQAKEVNYELKYGDIPICPEKQKNNQGTYEVQKGKGIVIG